MLLRHRFVCFRHSILTSHGWYILSQVQQFQTSSGFQVDARYGPVNSVCLHLETLHLYLFFINYFHESWIIYLKFNNYWILMNKLHINSLYEETAIFIHDISVRARVPGATSRHVATCRSRYQQRLNKHSSRYSTSTPEISRQTHILVCRPRVTISIISDTAEGCGAGWGGPSFISFTVSQHHLETLGLYFWSFNDKVLINGQSWIIMSLIIIVRCF